LALTHANREARASLRYGRDELWRIQFERRGLRRPSSKARRSNSDLCKAFFLTYSGKTQNRRFQGFFIDTLSLVPRLEHLFRKRAQLRKLKKLVPEDATWPINKKYDEYGGVTLVNLAARWSRNAFVAWLVQSRGADVNVPDNDGFTALCNAAFRGNLKLVHWLVRKVPDLDIDAAGSPCVTSSCGGKGPYTAEVWARRKGFYEVADCISRLRSRRLRKRPAAEQADHSGMDQRKKKLRRSGSKRAVLPFRNDEGRPRGMRRAGSGARVAV